MFAHKGWLINQCWWGNKDLYTTFGLTYTFKYIFKALEICIIDVVWDCKQVDIQ